LIGDGRMNEGLIGLRLGWSFTLMEGIY